jgi:hypothetical protein
MIHHIIALPVLKPIGAVKMDFLKRAERYAEARGDEMFFKHYYTLNRRNFSVRDSVRYTLQYMYDDHVADLLEYQ